jgi:lipoprotein-releasing system permease protein
MAISPSALFSVQQDFDISYVYSLYLTEVFRVFNEVSALEVYLEPTADLKSIQKNISQMLGSEFKVANRYQQQASLYKIMRTEKYAIFIILAFILIVATFTLIGSLSMVISEKQRDIAIYLAMGAPVSFIRKVFLYQRLWISMAGGIGGILLGAFICFLQQTFGFVKINTSGSSFVISQYPVEMQGMDFLVVFVFVIIIGIIASWIPARRSTQKSFTTYLRVE